MVTHDKTPSKLFTFMMSARLKSIAQDKAVRQGRSIGGYIRNLIEKDNEQHYKS